MPTGTEKKKPSGKTKNRKDQEVERDDIKIMQASLAIDWLFCEKKLNDHLFCGKYCFYYCISYYKKF